MAVTRRTLLGTSAAAVMAGRAKAASAGDATSFALLHDDGRRTVCRLMTPSTPGRWPVVLFSHGANSSSAAYDRLWSVWAARGYAVIGPDHVDTGPPATQTKPPPGGLWRARLADVALPLERRAPFDDFARRRGGSLDWRRLAAAGHSYGAVVAQALAGARLTDPLDHIPVAARLPEVAVCLAFSPPGPRPGFVPADAWASVRVPCLLQTGDADVLPGFVDDWRARLTGFAGSPDRWTLIGHGVNHYFGGLICRLDAAAGAQGPALDEAAALSADVLGAYLRQDPTALASLKTRAAQGDDGVVAFAAA